MKSKNSATGVGYQETGLKVPVMKLAWPPTLEYAIKIGLSPVRTNSKGIYFSSTIKSSVAPNPKVGTLI